MSRPSNDEPELFIVERIPHQSGEEGKFAESDKARLLDVITTDGEVRRVWVPKSISDLNTKDNGEIVMTIPKWFAEKEIY